MRVPIFFIALLMAIPVMAQDLVLRVSAKDVIETDLCSNCSPENIHISYWTIYKARVSEVVVGSFDQKYVRFAYAQHAQYTRKALKDFIVVLRPASSWLHEKTQVDYEVVNVQFPSQDGPNNSFKPTPHRGAGHVPALR